MSYRKLQKIIALSTLGFSMAVGHTVAFAQKAPTEEQGLHKHVEKSPEEMRQMHVRRLQGLHDRLKITSSQESLWQAFAEAYLPPQDKKMPPKPKDINQLSAPERIEMRLAFMQNEQSRLSNQLDKTKALYAQLSAEQQEILNKDDLFKPFHGFDKRGPAQHRDHKKDQK